MDGIHIGFPVGALHCSNFISPAPNVEVEVAAEDVSVPLALVLLVAVASPVGAATCNVVFVPSIVVSTSPAVGVVEVREEVPVVELEVAEVVVPITNNQLVLVFLKPYNTQTRYKTIHRMNSQRNDLTNHQLSAPHVQPKPVQEATKSQSATTPKMYRNAY